MRATTTLQDQEQASRASIPETTPSASIETTAGKEGLHPPRKRCCSCSWLRNWPRSTSCCLGIIIPLWLLILVSMGAGFLLALVEAPQEVETNNRILETRLNILLDGNRIEKQSQPILCLENNTDTHIVEVDVLGTALGERERVFSVSQTDVERVNLTWSNFTVCHNETRIKDALEVIYEKFQTFGEAYASLTFDWIRCYNRSELNPRTFLVRPTTATIEASHPVNQSAYYREEWYMDYQSIFRQVLGVLPTVNRQDILEASRYAASRADGGASCQENYAAGAWFWFTVMTTVGYGNTPPTTQAGRILTGCFGLVSIVLFATILFGAAFIFGAIVDDGLAKLGWEVWTRPGPGILLWGTCWGLWMTLIAFEVQNWWKTRNLLEATIGESYWFGFISTTTVGLGDYYLSPEVLFVADVFRFSLSFLIGFVFASTFIGKIGSWLASHYPSGWQGFQQRLKDTYIIQCKKPPEHASSFAKAVRPSRVEVLQQLLDEMEESSQQDTLLEEQRLIEALWRRMGHDDSARKAAFSVEDLDDNLLAMILSYLSTEDLHQCAQVAASRIAPIAMLEQKQRSEIQVRVKRLASGYAA